MFSGDAVLWALALVACVDSRVMDPRHHGNGNGRGGSANRSIGCQSAGAASAEAKAIYFMTNQATNSIISIPVAADGTLSEGTSIKTGGAGSNLIDTTTNAPAAPDALGSQGSVKVEGNLLFAVNAGSNTLSMFSISATDPTQLTMIGAPGATGGDFPSSVAASTTLNTACVGHTGAIAGISCAKFDAKTGLGAFDAIRPFNLGQTNPPTGPLNGIGDTFFNADSSALITTVKGNPPANNTGFVSSFPVANGAVSTKDTQISPAGTAVLFGTTLIPGTSNILATDASFGAAVLNLNNLSTPLATTKIADQLATCWAAVSTLTGTGFVTDVGVNHIVETDLSTGALITEFNSTNGNPGMIDLQTLGSKIFALSPGNGTIQPAVTVFDISGGPGSVKEVQNFAVAGLGVDKNAQGMALI